MTDGCATGNRLCRRLMPGMLLTVLLAAGAFADAADTDPRHPVESTRPHEFYFTRGIYGGRFEDEDWGPRWAVDYPKADQQFLVALKRLSRVDAPASEHALELSAPELLDYPFLYMLEVGALSLDEEQAQALRHYLLAGGFLVIDDFWGDWDWGNFEMQMARVFPEFDIVEIPLDHPVFHAFYDISEVLQVPNVHQASGGPTHEQGGRIPYVRGIFDNRGRLMVLINWNTDLGDAWEWADAPYYPLRYSTYAYQMGINFVIYAMTH